MNWNDWASIKDLARRGTVPMPTATQANTLLERMTSHLQRDVLIRQYLTAGQSGREPGRGPRLTEPWMVIAEQRMMAMIVSAGAARIQDGLNDIDPAVKRAGLAMTLWAAQPYLWSRDILNIVKACPLPRHVVSRNILPFPVTYHGYEVAFNTRSSDPTNPFSEDAEQDFVLFTDSLVGINCFVNIAEYRKNMTMLGSGIRYGQTYPDDFPARSRAGVGQFLSLLAFLQSPFVSTETRQCPRQWRRGADGVASQITDATVNVVVLRHAAKAAVDAHNDDSREFRHRWWVSGHFRAQWHPSTRAHEVIWIAPHLKGPVGAPMLEKVYAVRH